MAEELITELIGAMKKVKPGSRVELTDGEPFTIRRSVSSGDKVWEVECEDYTTAFIVIDKIVAIWI